MHPVHKYLLDMRAIHASGRGTAETSYYGPLEALLNSVGEKLWPRVRCVMQGRNEGAGIPDGTMATETLTRRRGKSAGVTLAMGLTPDRGAIEAKPLSDEVPRVASSKQVSSYLGLYKLVLVTNYREFLLVEERNGERVELERFKLADSEAEFWQAADDAATTSKQLGDRFTDFIERVMLQESQIESPEQVARFLASYARDARGALEMTDIGLTGLRTAIEESLGVEFRDDDGLGFFRSTVVQTLFYGLFSAWVIWHQEKPERASNFDWRTASWSLHLPAVGAVFTHLAQPSGVGRLGLSEQLDWATHLLNRVNRPKFFTRFEQEHAVQYFYEPFLKEFDPELRKQLGVWYTPPEVVKYMVARVDMALRDELGIADGLADPNVFVLDPCCGTGAYLVEVLRCIEATLKRNRGDDALIGADVRRAATERIFGFEILPAPFVIAHLQLGLHLQHIRAPFGQDERPGVYLTNALTGWEPAAAPPKSLLYPELDEERDAAEHVKRDRPILVVLGNPPYNGYAGVAVDEERDLTDAYRVFRDVPRPQGQGLNDLYVRFFRIAERRITEKTGRGIVCYITNYSWLDGLSFTGMREHYLRAFDAVWVDSLNGDKYKTGKLTPDGKPDPSIFSTESNREGIQVGTAITLLVRREPPGGDGAALHFRSLWGDDKRKQLVRSISEWAPTDYQQLTPIVRLGLPFVPTTMSAGYLTWPTLPELFPVSFPGVKTSRDQLVVDIDRERLEARMCRYFDPQLSDEEIAREMPVAMERVSTFEPRDVRTELLKKGFSQQAIIPFAYRPFDVRWLYWESETKLLDRKREEFVDALTIGMDFMEARQKEPKDHFDRGWVTSALADNMGNGLSSFFPRFVRGVSEPVANVSERAAIWLESNNMRRSDTFNHAVAVMASELYRTENRAGLVLDWPRIPLPALPELLPPSAVLGSKLADLMNPATALPGITAGAIRPELKIIASLEASKQDFLAAARWGISGKDGVAMPGPGKLNERPYTADEMSQLQQGADALGISLDALLACLGERTYDVYLNDSVYWKSVPSRVWLYSMGGYQVLKKWLSYREAALLGRPLKVDEVRYFQDVARRIAAILLLGPTLDANYREIRDNAMPWPPV